MEEYARLAESLAHEAGEIMRSHFRAGVPYTLKEDQSPLTEADQKIHELVLARLTQAFPDHRILGEEGEVPSDSEYAWIFDPIDGTVPFLRGIPTNVFSIALTKDGEPIVGVVYDPHLDRLYKAVKDGGATVNGAPLQASNRTALHGSYVEVDGFGGFSNLAFLERLREQRVRFLSFCSFVYANMLVASGQLEAAVFSRSNPWDAAAAKVIVEEAGGVTSDLLGKTQRYDRLIHGFIAAGTPELHQELRHTLSESLPNSQLTDTEAGVR